MGASHTLQFLGTGGSCGVPSYYCGCKACQEALEHPEFRRNCSGVAISGEETVLLDTPPGLNLQLSLAGISEIKAALFTHEHYDHTGGLPDLEYYTLLRKKTPFPLYCSARVASLLDTRFDWMKDIWKINLLEPFVALELDGVTYTPLPAAHCPEALGFLVETQGSQTAYFPDTGPLFQQTAERLMGIDNLIIDCTFHGNNWMPEKHQNVDTALEIARSLEVKNLYLTHLTMHYHEPICAQELEEQMTRADIGGGSITVARDLMKFEI